VKLSYSVEMVVSSDFFTPIALDCTGLLLKVIKPCRVQTNVICGRLGEFIECGLASCVSR